MELTKKERTIKYITFAVVILAAALCQNVLSPHLEIGGARCFILLPAAVMLGINEDEKLAALYGLFAGALCDMVSAQTRGFHCIYIMTACYIASALVTFIFRSTFWYQLICAVLTVIFFCLLYWLLFVFIGGGEGSAYMLLRFYLPSALYTIALSPFVYLLLKPLGEKLNKIEKIAD